MEEKTLWKGRPARRLFLFLSLRTWLRLLVGGRATHYKITDERLIITKGRLSRKVEEIELYRVKDTGLSQGMRQRLFRIGHVDVTTSDANAPEVTLSDVPNPSKVREILRRAVENRRDAKQVREIDFS